MRALVVLALVSACTGVSDDDSEGTDADTDTDVVAGLEFPGTDWTEANPEDRGLDSAAIDAAMAYAFVDGRNTQGVVIIKDGYLVAERYAANRDADSIATSWSVGKSFTSALIGIAVDDGSISSIDDSAADYLPVWSGTGNAAVSVRHLLEMRSGLPEPTENNGIYFDEVDQLAVALDRELTGTPGQTFQYVNADSMTLTGILEGSTGENSLDFANERLFSPLQMQADWWVDGSGHALGYCCIDTTSRDFARFGLLYSRGGMWQDQRIVSQAWVDESTAAAPGLGIYGLHWWVAEEAGAFTAIGLHDQYITVVPEHDLVVVRNGLYTRMGTETVRKGLNYHQTEPASNWNQATFLAPILDGL